MNAVISISCSAVVHFGQCFVFGFVFMIFGLLEVL